MDGENTQQRRAVSRRCRVCLLPADTLTEVHRQRLALGATYDDLAEQVLASGRRCSTSSLRRHFRHVGNCEFQGGELAGGTLEEIATPFDLLVGSAVDDRAVADAVVNVLVEQLRHVEKVRRATRDGTQADRLTARSLKQIAALDRALRRRHEVKKPYEELRAKLNETLARLPEAAGEACRTLMNEHLTIIDKAVDGFLRDYQYPDRLLRRLNEAKAEFPKLFASRMVGAVQSVTQEIRDSLR